VFQGLGLLIFWQQQPQSRATNEMLRDRPPPDIPFAGPAIIPMADVPAIPAQFSDGVDWNALPEADRESLRNETLSRAATKKDEERNIFPAPPSASRRDREKRHRVVRSAIKAEAATVTGYRGPCTPFPAVRSNCF